MRKKGCTILSMLLCIVMISGCGSRGKPSNLSEESYELGVYAVEAIDDYLDGKEPLDSTRDMLDELHVMAEAVPESSDFLTSVNDSSVSTKILLADTTLFTISYNIEKGNRVEARIEEDKLLEERNDLAKKLNMKAR